MYAPLGYTRAIRDEKLKCRKEGSALGKVQRRVHFHSMVGDVRRKNERGASTLVREAIFLSIVEYFINYSYV